MKKKRILAFVLASCGLGPCLSPAFSQDCVVRLTTSKAVGTEMTFLVNSTYSGVSVDWGDGNPVVYTSDDPVTEITGTVRGSGITLSGPATWELFSCAGQDVTSLDLTGAKKLRSLYCQDNALSALSLAGMSGLVDLDCSGNDLEAITYTTAGYPERDLPVIENMNVADNRLSGSFNVRTSTLHALDISGNDITTVYTSSNPSLDMLKCSGNQLTSLSVASCKSISTLVCDGNTLTNLILPSGVTTLQQLVCDNNAISVRVDLSGCTDLKDVSIANNKISTLLLPTYTKTSSLSLADNKLTLSNLPRQAQKPAFINFMPQALLDISGLANVKEAGDVPYIDVASWADRRNTTVDLNTYRRIGVTSTSAGTIEGVISWYAVDEDGKETLLVKSTSESDGGDYYESNGATAFLKPQRSVYARITADKVYKSEGFYVETTRISVGQDAATGIVSLPSSSGLEIAVSGGELILKSASGTAVLVYAADGRLVWRGNVSGTSRIALPSGVYVVNGHKVAL